jgi:hypothetical protein
MRYNWICCLGIAIGIVCCVCKPRLLDSKDSSKNQEKWLFILDQIRAQSEKLKTGECTIVGRMFSPENPGISILIDHKFEIRVAFARPLKYRWVGHFPAWIVDPAQSGVDEQGNPTSGNKFDEQTAVFAANGPDGAWWRADQGWWINLLSRSEAEDRLDKTLYFPEIAYLTLYTSGQRWQRARADEIIDALKKQQNVSIDDSSPIWQARWTDLVEVSKAKVNITTVMEVDTKNGFTVTRFAYIVRRLNGMESVQEELTAKWEHRNGAYVPVHYTTQLGFKKSPSYITTEVDVSWSSVNNPLPDSLFEWRSFDVPPTTGVMDSRGTNPKLIREMNSASDSDTMPRLK